MRKFLAPLFAVFYLAATIVAQAGFLINSYSVAAGGGPADATVTFIGCTELTTDLTTYSYTSAAIGTASSDRIVIVAAMGVDTGQNDFSTSSMTIGGVTAAEQVDTASTLQASQASIYTLLVTSGTTATIAVTYSEAITSSTICVWSTTGLSSATKTDFASAVQCTSGDCVLDTDVQAGGIIVGATNYIDNSKTWTWTGLTERADVAGTEMAYTAADLASSGAQAPVTILSNGNVNISYAAVAAAFR